MGQRGRGGPLGKGDADERRFDQLYTDTFREVYAYCLRRVDRRADVDDVVSEVYATVWRRLDDAANASAPLAWIYGIAYRTIGNHHRGRRRAGRLFDRLSQQVPEGQRDLSEGVDSAELIAATQRAIAGLQETDRELLQLTIWEELSPTEIAAALDLEVATVRSRLYRARQRLQRDLDVVTERDGTAEPDTDQLNEQTDQPDDPQERDGRNKGTSG